MSIDRYIQGKKLLFLRTIVKLEDDAICKRLLKERTLEFSQNHETAKCNEFDSPIYDLLNTCEEMGLYDICKNMIINGHMYSKQQWKRLVWERLWEKEDEECTMKYMGGPRVPALFKVLDRSYYLIWWIISDNNPKLMKMCEKMAALVNDASKLKAHDCSLKKASFWAKACTNCDLGIVEDTKHVIMQCPQNEEVRKEMFQEIKELGINAIDNTFENANDYFPVLLGKQPENVETEDMIKLCMITGKHITNIYDNIMKG